MPKKVKSNANPKNLSRNEKKPQLTKEQITALQSRALALYAEDETHAKQLGAALLDLKAALKHGEFNKWWTKHKLSQNRVSYCMRLAAGKVKAYKIKRSLAPERVAASEVKQHVDGFLKTVGRANTLDEIDKAMGTLCLFIVGGIQRVKGYPRINAEGLELEAAVRSFKQSLSNLLDAAFKPGTLDDLDRVTNRGYDGYAKQAAETGTAAAAKAGA